MNFVVTGFGPFRNVPNNPTTVIVENLVDYLKTKSSCTESGGNDNYRNEYALLQKIAESTRTFVLETSVEDVQRRIDALYADITAAMSQKQNNGDNDNNGNKSLMTVFLHLGVNCDGSQFEIESCAYNNADFRVPDERGFRPTKQVIVPGQKLDATYETALNVAELVSRIHKNSAQPATLSTDPGRFVCNYTYFYSLVKFGCCKAIDGQEIRSADLSDNTRCLFLHVPPFSVIPESDQMEFVVFLMKTIYEQHISEMD